MLIYAVPSWRDALLRVYIAVFDGLATFAFDTSRASPGTASVAVWRSGARHMQPPLHLVRGDDADRAAAGARAILAPTPTSERSSAW